MTLANTTFFYFQIGIEG